MVKRDNLRRGKAQSGKHLATDGVAVAVYMLMSMVWRVLLEMLFHLLCSTPESLLLPGSSPFSTEADPPHVLARSESVLVPRNAFPHTWARPTLSQQSHRPPTSGGPRTFIHSLSLLGTSKFCHIAVALPTMREARLRCNLHENMLVW